MMVGKEVTKRNKLTVKNQTHEDFGEDEMPGIMFKLNWSRDVDRESDVTEKLDPGEEDTKQSRGIGNGDNCRYFDIETIALDDDGVEYLIGKFTHSIYASGGSNGEHDDTTLRFNRNTWVIYRKYTLFKCDGSPTPEPATEDIGPIPFKLQEILKTKL